MVAGGRVGSHLDRPVGIWPLGPSSADAAGRALQVLGFVNGLHRQIHGLDVQWQPLPGHVQPAGVTPAFLTAWDGFYRAASTYIITALRHPLALGTASVLTRIESFGAQAMQWREAYMRAGGTPIGPELVPEMPADPIGDFMKQFKQLLWAMAGVGAVGAVGYALIKYRPWERIGRKARPATSGWSR